MQQKRAKKVGLHKNICYWAFNSFIQRLGSVKDEISPVPAVPRERRIRLDAGQPVYPKLTQLTLYESVTWIKEASFTRSVLTGVCSKRANVTLPL